MTELKRLAKNCEYEELTNSIIKDRIVEGINNDSTRARLLREKELFLERCVEICKAAEVDDKHMEVLTDQSREPRDINAVSRGKNYRGATCSGFTGNGSKSDQKSNNRSNCTRCGQGNHSYNKCPAVGKECKKCHRLNHFMSQCKTGDKKLPKYPTKPRVHEIEKSGKQETDGDPSSDEHEFYIDSTETTADKSDPWIVPLEVNNNVAVFKVDTGSGVNVMSYNEFKTCRKIPFTQYDKLKA